MDDRLSAEVHNAEHLWDEKARSSGNDALRAGCRDTAEENTCIDRVQRTLARRAMERIRRLRRLSGTAVLDYGCGAGRWADCLRAYGCLYTGVDLPAGMLEIVRRQHPDIEFRKNGLVVPYGNRTFDLVWSVAVVHHNPPARQEKLFAEFARVLHNGGFLVLLEGVGPDGRPPEPLYYPRTRSAWSALAQRHGLSLRWRCGASYFALRWLAEGLWWRIGAGGGARATREGAGGGLANSPQAAAWLRLAARVDAVLCPQLVGCLPPPLQRRVIMVFQKRSAQELAGSWVREASVSSSQPGSPLGPGKEPARVAPRADAGPRRAGSRTTQRADRAGSPRRAATAVHARRAARALADSRTNVDALRRAVTRYTGCAPSTCTKSCGVRRHRAGRRPVGWPRILPSSTPPQLGQLSAAPSRQWEIRTHCSHAR